MKRVLRAENKAILNYLNKMTQPNSKEISRIEVTKDNKKWGYNIVVQFANGTKTKEFYADEILSFWPGLELVLKMPIDSSSQP